MGSLTTDDIDPPNPTVACLQVPSFSSFPCFNASATKNRMRGTRFHRGTDHVNAFISWEQWLLSCDPNLSNSRRLPDFTTIYGTSSHNGHAADMAASGHQNKKKDHVD
jgi:hypothetical protein